jgi:hypothetical protein
MDLLPAELDPGVAQQETDEGDVMDMESIVVEAGTAESDDSGEQG